jgi:hypothetical protein
MDIDEAQEESNTCANIHKKSKSFLGMFVGTRRNIFTQKTEVRGICDTGPLKKRKKTKMRQKDKVSRHGRKRQN